jgi:beta-galactosidase
MFALSLHTDKTDHEAGYALLRQLAERPRKLDPTRQWISVDGDQDLDGSLPVWSKHMGMGLPRDLPDTAKPRMIGEHGGTYYAGPPLLSAINGDRAYESYRGRNEALAYDAYRMATEVARPELTAFSESEVVWFGLEQLPFGYASVTRPPDKTDGIFFPTFVENVPGVQIERLPPYVTTLNPGFDPTLPAFRPLPLYEAMKAAINPMGPQASPWSKFPVIAPGTRPALPAHGEAVSFLGGPTSELYRNLAAMGVPFVPSTNNQTAKILVVDGETISEAQVKESAAQIREVLNGGGLVWVMVVEKGAALRNLKDVLGAEVVLTNRPATSLVQGKANSVVGSLSLKDLYFADEPSERRIQKVGLAGPFVEEGTVLLTACGSDWTLFERQPEAAKCASMLIYEHLQKPAGASLVETARGTGRLWVSTLNPAPESPAFASFWSHLWGCVGVRLDKSATPAQQKKLEHDLLLDGPPK